MGSEGGMTIGRRLSDLETRYPRPVGCPVCRDWSPRAYLRDDEAPRPETCPRCGRSVPIRLTRRYLIVPSPAEVVP